MILKGLSGYKSLQSYYIGTILLFTHKNIIKIKRNTASSDILMVLYFDI